MAEATITTKTWYCPVCGYHQNTDPYDATIQHHKDYWPNVPLGKCVMGWLTPTDSPACHDQDMGLDLRADRLVQVEVANADDFAAVRVVEHDDEGLVVMEDSGETKFQLNSRTGQIEEVPVMVEKMRSLTQDELDARLAKAQEQLDALPEQEFDPRQVG